MMAAHAISTVEAFYSNLAVPDSCLLAKRLYKKQFYEKGQLNAADKKAFVEDIESITWKYTLKPNTINIPRYEDDTYEYLEIAVLEVTLTSGKRYKRISDVMQKAIPYPLVIVFAWRDSPDTKLALSVADKRINRADSNKIVIEATHETDWIKLDDPAAWQQDFLRSFCVTDLSYRNLLAFYQDILDRITALACAAHTGHYTAGPKDNTARELRLEDLKQLDRLEKERTELRNKLKKEKNMGTQVQLNVRVRQITDRIETIKNKL